MDSQSDHSKFGLITHGWTCAYMQRNTKRINVNHWMKHSTSEGIDELVTWIEWPPSAWITSNQLETTLEEQLHVVHHTMAGDPMPGAKIPSRPASLFGRSDQIKLAVALSDVARRNIGCSINSRWILSRSAWHFHTTCSTLRGRYLSWCTCVQDTHWLKCRPPKHYK